jgi:hypothetical protein
MRRVALVIALLLGAGCSSPASPSPSIGAEQARSIAVGVFEQRHAVGEVISDVTSSVALTPGVETGPNAGRQVWTVKVDGRITDANEQSYISHFWIEVDTQSGVPSVIGTG